MANRWSHPHGKTSPEVVPFTWQPTSTDTDVIRHEFWLCVFGKTPVRRNKSTRTHPSNLASLQEFGFALCFVRALLVTFVERGVHSRCGILHFFRKQLVHGF